MSINSRKIILGIPLLIACIHSHSNSSYVSGTIDVELNNPGNYALKSASSANKKTIKILKLNLSNKIKKSLLSRANPKTSLIEHQASTPQSKQLGMNNTPVLDQGPYGTCVTFAATAVVDSLIGQGDYISQLCQLELGTYLESTSNGTYPSGWDGSYGDIVLGQMSTYGIISKKNQYTQGCDGLRYYPSYIEIDTSKYIMDPQYFTTLSEKLDDKQITWEQSLSMEEAFSDPTSPQRVLLDIKKEINNGNRVQFGVILSAIHQGVVGATGTYISKFDTWVLNDEAINELIKIMDGDDSADLGGHEMVITGYDDNAIIVDDKNIEHQGVITLRNSWGTQAGNNGDFYMTYDYFNMFADEVYKIKKSQ